MMNRGNMGKEISTAPKSKKVKKMQVGGMARPMGGSVPAEMQRGRPGGPGMGRPGMVMPPSMGPGGMPRPPAGGPGFFGGGAPRPGTPQAGMMEAMLNNRAAGMKKGGSVKGMAKGGAAKCMATGGSVQRGDGCAMKGKTKGTMR